MAENFVVTNLNTRRRELVTSMRRIVDLTRDERRDLTPAETDAVLAYDREIGELDERIEQLRDAERRTRAAEDSFADLLARPRTGPHGEGSPNAELDKRFRTMVLDRDPRPLEIPPSSPRSGFQPGIERRAAAERAGLEQRSLATTSGSGLVSTSFWDQILAHLIENSAVLGAGATVLQTQTGEPLKIPKSTGFSTAAIVTEGGTIGTSDPTPATATLTGFKYGFLVQVTTELLRDASFDVTGFLAAQAAQAIALAWGNHAINGTGTAQPRGVITDATVGVTGPTGTTVSFGTQSTAGQGGDLLGDLIASVAEPYTRSQAAAFLMRTTTLNLVRKLKDSTGQYVFSQDAPAGSGASGSIFGKPVYVDPAVPAMAANAKSVLYGDWSRVFVRQVGPIRFERSDDFAWSADLSTFRCLATIDSALVDTTGAIKWFANSAT